MAFKTWAGTKILIDGKEVNQVLSFEIKASQDSLQTVVIELPMETVTQNCDGSITLGLVGNVKR